MLQGEHSAVLSTFNKLPFVMIIKTFVIWLFLLSGRFTQVFTVRLKSDLRRVRQVPKSHDQPHLYLLTLCLRGIFSCFLSSADFFSKSCFTKKPLRVVMGVTLGQFFLSLKRT